MTNRLMAIREIPKHRSSVIILASVLIGLVLARFVMISPIAGIMVLSLGIVLAVTVLLRRTDYLIFSWFVLTSLVWVFVRALPAYYYPIVGRGLFWGLLVCIIVAWALDNILRDRRFVPFDNLPLKAITLIFVSWCIMTLFTSIDVFNSVKKLSHIVIGLVVSYMFYDFISRDQNNMKKMLGVLLFIVVSISLIAVVIAGHSLVRGVAIYKEIGLWFYSPNSLGYLLFMSIPILITAGLYLISSRSLRFFFATVMLLALFISFHRTSWLAALVSLVYILWKSRMKKSVSTAIFVGLFLVALLFPIVGGEFYDYITGEQYTGRREIWQAALHTACDYPVFGTGPGNVGRILPKYIDTPWLKHEDTHSLYLKNAAEMGFASVVFLLAVYAVFIYSSERIEKNLKSHHLKLVTRGVTATFVGLLVHGIFENGFFLTAFVAGEFHTMLAYIIMPLPFAAKKLEERGESG